MNVIRHTFSIPTHISESFSAAIPPKERSKTISEAMSKIAEDAQKQRVLSNLAKLEKNPLIKGGEDSVQLLREIRAEAS